jgi:hypothetical protein
VLLTLSALYGRHPCCVLRQLLLWDGGKGVVDDHIRGTIAVVVALSTLQKHDTTQEHSVWYNTTGIHLSQA